MTLKPLVVREVKSFLKNPAFIMSIIILVVFYASLGGIMRTSVESAVREASSISIGVVKEEDTPLVNQLIAVLNHYTNGSLGFYSSLDEAVEKAGVAILIPRGFTVNATTPGRSLMLKGGVKIESLSPIISQARLSVVSSIASTLSNLLPVAISQLYNVSVEPGKQVVVDNYVRIYGRTMTVAEFNAVVGVLSMIPTLIGLVVGINAAYAAQATAIEKVEKAFEMLLAQPIPRRSVVVAKIIGAVVASMIMGTAYMVAMLLMLVSVVPSDMVGNESSQLIQSTMSVAGPFVIALIIFSMVLGLIYSGAMGVLVGAVVSDERMAGVLSTPIILLFMGVGFAVMYLGMPLNTVTAVLSGLSIVPIAFVVINASLSGQYVYAALSVSIAVLATLAVMLIAIVVFNRDIVVLGLRVSLRRRE